MALVVKDNTPSPGFISWTGLHIVYKGVDYTIQDGNTNKRFVYWKPSVSTTVLQTSDTLPELGDDDLLVFLNKNGIHVTVPTSTVVEGSLIVEESILTNALAANAVTAEKIASGAIEARHLAAESVTADAIAAGAIGAGAIAAGAILSEAIASGQVLADHIAAGQIQSNHIAANQIQANHITSGAITADKIASNAVTAAKIAAGAVTVDKIAIFGSSRVDELYVRGTGFNNPANRQVRLGNTFLVNGGGRGFCLTVIKRSDHSHLSYRRDGTPSSTLAASQVYDVYDKDEDRLALRNALIELRTNANGTRANGEWGSDIIIIITSYDAWRTYLAYGNELVDELLNHGASEAIRWWDLIRTPYLLIGIPGIGEGRGIEILTDDDPTAPWAEYSGLLINGNLAGLGGLLPGSVSATIIQDGAVTADKIAANAVTADKIASNAITADKIAADAITADKIAVSQLSAIASNIGTITAGVLRNSANTSGILLSGTVPSGWNQYLNLSDSSKPFLQHPNLVLNQDGSATFSGVVESSEFNASISRFWRAWFRDSASDRVFVVTASGIQWRTNDSRFSAGINVFENPGIGVIGNVYGMHLQLDAMVLVNRTNSGFSLTGVGYELKATPDGDGWMTTGAFEVIGQLRVNEIRSRSHPTTQIELDDLGLRLTGGDYILGTWHSVPTGSTGGLYHQGGKIHIYAQDSNYWRVNSGSGMIFYSGGINATRHGYIYHDGGNYFGLRSADANWRVRVYNGGVYLHGTVEVLGSLFKSSSQRWKKNVRAWAPDPRILLSLRPVEFDFVEERGGNHDYGFIAEEVPEVFATENRESVSFDRITTALVVGWQDHESRIAALERALKKLERV